MNARNAGKPTGQEETERPRATSQTMNRKGGTERIRRGTLPSAQITLRQKNWSEDRQVAKVRARARARARAREKEEPRERKAQTAETTRANPISTPHQVRTSTPETQASQRGKRQREGNKARQGREQDNNEAPSQVPRTIAQRQGHAKRGKAAKPRAEQQEEKVKRGQG